MSKVAIPQADEQQRLLANLITQMNLDRTPLPRFWYLPGRQGGRRAHRRRPRQRRHRGPVRHLRGRQPGRMLGGGLAVRALDLVRLPVDQADRRPGARPISAPGFEIALHLGSRGPTRAPRHATTSRPPRARPSTSRPAPDFAARWPSLEAPVTSRTHCVVWSDWASVPKAEREHGIRLDTNYYYWPASWVQNRPGHVHGLRVPDALRRRRRLADRRLPGGDPAHRRVGHRRRQRTSRRCSTARSGPRATTASSPPTCTPTCPTTPGADAIVAAAKARGVPVVSAKQMLAWLDGRNGSSFRRRASRRRAALHGRARRRRARPRGDGARRSADRRAARAHARRRAGGRDAAHGEGHRLRDLRAAAGDYVGDLPPATVRPVPQLMLAADDPSRSLLPADREARRPADAEALSHKLMVRAGLVRQVGAGLWTWLPAGWRVHQQAVQIVREEMDAIGGQEMLMPVLHAGRAVEAQPAATTSTSSSSSRTAGAPSWCSR